MIQEILHLTNLVYILVYKNKNEPFNSKSAAEIVQAH